MGEVWVKEADNVRYRVKGYTSDDFEEDLRGIVFFDSPDDEISLSLIANRVVEYECEHDPDAIFYKCNVYKCNVDLLYGGRVYSFEVIGEAKIEWDSKLKEVKEHEGACGP